MCGIAGVWSDAPLPPELRVADRLDAALAHRGPDGHLSASRDGGRLLLVHRRLAIIECGPSGSQPMTTGDGRHTIIFNGEIYNHGELRQSLEREGERFESRSDTEVLLRIIARRGPAALAEVRGMFALAFWDAADRTLLVARDRFGIKPLYVAPRSDRLVFASEIRALVDAGLCAREIDPAGVLGYLRWGSIPAPLTWLRGVSAVEPGTWSRWSHGFARECGRFADVRDLWIGDHTEMSECDLRDRTRTAFRDAVRAHLVADVPVGVFLSGGIDSAALVATAAAERPGLHTFTVAFDAATQSEEHHAAEIARRFDTLHTTLHLDPRQLLADWPAILEHMDQPTLDAVNTYFVSKAVAATGVKAVLSGVGGDELFGGYPSFTHVPRGARIGRLPQSLRALAGRIAASGQKDWRAHKVQYAADHADSVFELYRAVRGWMMPAELDAVAGPALRDPAIAARLEVVERGIDREAPESIHAAVARLETTMYMRHQLLRDVDVMSMAHGLEVRVPFIDHQLVRAVWPGLGRHSRLLARKRLLVESLNAALPETVTARPKQGFTLPFEDWLDGPLSGFVRDGLNEAAGAGWIAASAPDAVLGAWQKRACHWSRPWGLAVLGHFVGDR